MVRIYWIKANDTGRIEAYRYKENAEIKLAEYKERPDGDRFSIEEVDTPISELPEWSWFWEYSTKENEYKNAILCEVDD